MKNISKAISGCGFLISGAILIGTCQTFNYKLRLLGFMLSLVFIVAGIMLSITANVENSTDTNNIDTSDDNK